MFGDISTLEELKKRYRELCKTYHPDKGGSTAQMQQINNEYSSILERLMRGEPSKVHESGFDPMAHELRVREALEKIAHLEGLEIEIIGNWIWVGGETRTHKDALKAAKYYWASKRKLWYFQGTPCKGNGKPLEELRAKYGSSHVPVQTRARLNT
jgi:hypothetical protein